MNVVIVESPAKAKTINRYLGPDYMVLASYGHVRDLPAKDGSVRPEAEFAMDWEIDPKASKHLRAIAEAVRGAKRLYLATDPDREGEAISWHVCEVLDQKRMLAGVDVKRVVFNEITRIAIVDAFARPRDLDRPLINAYLARRALDYLVGFTLSPVLWRKLPGSRSAGRVQSVALRLICERETEIEAFRSREYWTVEGVFATATDETFAAGLTHLDGRKLDKFDLADEGAARRATAEARRHVYSVSEIERKQVRRNPPPPFITSTLQQEASRKLGFSATTTMRTAQRLYEGVNIGGEVVGLITYMRTDGVQMAADAISACRARIRDDYSSRYVPEKPRIYKSKVKNAQEAHECVRPTDVNRKPEMVASYLEPDQLKLYTLIWKRAIASQMEQAILDQVAIDIASADRKVRFRATGSVVAFDGFLKVYREGRDEPDREAEKPTDDASDRLLPAVATDDPLDLQDITPEQHFTQPPPRYTEASLVKKLEELGIGRPSTYATILSVLQDRKYVRLDSKRFVPEDRGRLVTAFLTSFFERYVAYGFTAEMEEKLDTISDGRIDWRAVLGDFWKDFAQAVEETKGLRTRDVLDALDRILGPHFFADRDDSRDPRLCPSCGEGRLSIKLGKFGAFIGCDRYQEGCRFTRPLVQARLENGVSGEATEEAALEGGGRVLGADPETGQVVTVKRGPYGVYLQLGLGGESGTASKPKRTSLPRDVDPLTIDLATACRFLALPRRIGMLPESREEITAGIGRFGPYVRAGDRYVALKKGDDVLTIGANRAIELLQQAIARKPKGRVLGHHPADGKPVTARAGRYGPIVEWNGTRATLSKGMDVDTVALEDALSVLATRVAKAQPKGKPVKAAKQQKPTVAAADKTAARQTKTKRSDITETPAVAAAVDQAPVRATSERRARRQ